MPNLPAPRSNTELRAPKTAGIRGRRDAPAVGPQSSPYARLVMGEKGGSIRGSTSLSSDGSQPESCSGCLDPRDGSTRSIASQRLAPRAKRRPAAPAVSLIQNNKNYTYKYAHASTNRIQKNSTPSSQTVASESPIHSILPRCKSCRAV